MEFKQRLIAATGVLVLLFTPILVSAHQPFIEPRLQGSGEGLLLKALMIPDPAIQSQAVYGSIGEEGEYDVYAFEATVEATLPVELLVPIRPANDNFRPSLFIFAKDLPAEKVIEAPDLPVEVPFDYQVAQLRNDHSMGIFSEPFSQERYYKGERLDITVKPNQNYFLVVYEPNSTVGDYSLGIGTEEKFSDVGKFELLKNVFLLKMGYVGTNPVSGWDLIGIFLFIAGFIVGLGAVTVIDVLGFRGRHSGYWTEATIRAHKVTKPLIWLGLAILILGGLITYRESWFSGVALFQAIIVLILIVNGLFLTFRVSPILLQKEKDEDELEEMDPLSHSLRNQIAISFAISFIGWWTMLFLLVWYIVVMR